MVFCSTSIYDTQGPGSKTARRLGGNVDSPNQSPLARIQISGLLRLENTWKYIAPPVDAQLKNIC